MNSEAVFIQVGALADGFAPQSNILEKQHGLAGKRLMLHCSEGDTLVCQFNDETTLNWGEYQNIAYRVTSIRPEILFIDFFDPARENATITLVGDCQKVGSPGVRQTTR
jgi:hypothetical protein